MNKEIIEMPWAKPRKRATDQRGKDRLDLIAAKRDELESEIQRAYAIIKDTAAP